MAAAGAVAAATAKRNACPASSVVALERALPRAADVPTLSLPKDASAPLGRSGGNIDGAADRGSAILSVLRDAIVGGKRPEGSRGKTRER